MCTYVAAVHYVAVADPDIHIRGGGGGRGVGGHPDPEIREMPGLQKKFFQSGLKIRGGQAPRAPPLDLPLCRFAQPSCDNGSLLAPSLRTTLAVLF